MEGRAMRLALTIAAYTSVLMAQPETWTAHHEAARKAIDERKFDVAVTEARAAFEAVSREGPSDPRYIRTLLDQADADVQTTDFSNESRLLRAIMLAERNGVFSKEPGLENDLRSGVLLRASRMSGRAYGGARYAEAVAEGRVGLAQLARLKPPDAKAAASHFNRVGLALKGDGYYPIAETVFQRALAVQENGLLLANLADLYLRVGRYKDAQAAIERAITLDAGGMAQANDESSVAFDRSMRLAMLNNELAHYDV